MSISDLRPGTAEAIDRFAIAINDFNDARTELDSARRALVDIVSGPGDETTDLHIVRNSVIYHIRRPGLHSVSREPSVEILEATTL